MKIANKTVKNKTKNKKHNQKKKPKEWQISMVRFSFVFFFLSFFLDSVRFGYIILTSNNSREPKPRKSKTCIYDYCMYSVCVCVGGGVCIDYFT